VKQQAHAYRQGREGIEPVLGSGMAHDVERRERSHLANRPQFRRVVRGHHDNEPLDGGELRHVVQLMVCRAFR
jgi:hypothetical protein